MKYILYLLGSDVFQYFVWVYGDEILVEDLFLLILGGLFKEGQFSFGGKDIFFVALMFLNIETSFNFVLIESSLDLMFMLEVVPRGISII